MHHGKSNISHCLNIGVNVNRRDRTTIHLDCKVQYTRRSSLRMRYYLRPHSIFHTLGLALESDQKRMQQSSLRCCDKSQGFCREQDNHSRIFHHCQFAGLLNTLHFRLTPTTIQVDRTWDQVRKEVVCGLEKSELVEQRSPNGRRGWCGPISGSQIYPFLGHILCTLQRMPVVLRVHENCTNFADA